jgi:hypothetical protein
MQGEATVMGRGWNPNVVRQQFRSILQNGHLVFGDHALEEMDKDSMTEQDVRNVLRAGFPDPPEMENGEERYRVHTQRMCVVCAFRSTDELRVVTAWRNHN